jgi:hypothetical protein
MSSFANCVTMRFAKMVNAEMGKIKEMQINENCEHSMVPLHLGQLVTWSPGSAHKKGYCPYDIVFLCCESSIGAEFTSEVRFSGSLRLARLWTFPLIIGRSLDIGFLMGSRATAAVVVTGILTS